MRQNSLLISYANKKSVAPIRHGNAKESELWFNVTKN